MMLFFLIGYLYVCNRTWLYSDGMHSLCMVLVLLLKQIFPVYTLPRSGMWPWRIYETPYIFHTHAHFMQRPSFLHSFQSGYVQNLENIGKWFLIVKCGNFFVLTQNMMNWFGGMFNFFKRVLLLQMLGRRCCSRIKNVMIS